MHSIAALVLASVALEARAQDAGPANPGGSANAPQAGPYASAIRAAEEALEQGDFEVAERTLASTDLASRGFEWAHLRLAIELARSAGAAPGLRATGRARAAEPTVRVEPISRLCGHGEACRAVAISPAGDRIASSGLEHEIRLWNARSGDVDRVLAGHADAVPGLAFSPDGARLASASRDGSARIWDAADGRVLSTLKAGTDPLCAIAWSPDGAWIATADERRVVRLYDPGASEARSALRGHAGAITSLSFSGDSRLVASSSEDGTVRLVDVKSGELVRAIASDGTAARACRFDPGSTRITVAFQNGSIRRFDLAPDARTQRIRSGDVALHALAFTTDGRRFATGSEEGLVQVWDTAGTLLYGLRVSNVAVRSLAFDARATRLVACGDDRTVYVIETDAALARALQRGAVQALPSVEAAATMKPLEVEALCRRVVERAGLDAALYTNAEALSRATLERVGVSGQVHTTLGGAIYRLERYEEALAVLTTANEAKRGWPPNLAFRAMALARLSRTDEARAMLQRLDTLMLEGRWESDVEARALRDESRAVVDAAKPAPK